MEDLLNKYYNTKQKYAFIEIKDTLVFNLSSISRIEESIIDIKERFGNSIFDNIELVINATEQPIRIMIKKNGSIIENYAEALEGPQTKINKNVKLSVREAKEIFKNIGNETVVLHQDEIMIPIIYDGLMVELSNWESNIGKVHPDLISARLFNEAMEQFATNLEPKIKS